MTQMTQKVPPFKACRFPRLKPRLGDYGDGS